MTYIMKNKIPGLLKDRGVSVTDLHADIVTKTGQRLSYQALLDIAKEEAANHPLPDGIRVGSLKLIAIALGVTLSDLAEIEAV